MVRSHDDDIVTGVIARLEFELAYYDVAVLHISHNATRTSSVFVGL